MTNGKVQRAHRVKANHAIEVEAGPHRRANTKDHLVVGDILKFAKALEESGADDWEQVRALWVDRDGYLLRSLAVYWSTDETNGQPTPQVKAKDVP